MSDWLVAFDNALIGRPQHCTLCGQPQTEAWFAIHEVAGLSVATLLCPRCRARDPDQAQLRALLDQRYTPERGKIRT